MSANLPDGFILDQPAPAASLPAGFVLDKAPVAAPPVAPTAPVEHIGLDDSEDDRFALMKAQQAQPAGVLPNKNAPESSWLETGADTMKQVPASFQKAVGGIREFIGHANVPEDKAFNDHLIKLGQDTVAAATATLQANAPNVVAGSGKDWANKLGLGIAQTIPAMGASFLTGSAMPLIAQAGGTSFGNTYADEITKNPNDPDGAATKATAVGTVDAAAAAIGIKAFGIQPFASAMGKITNEATGEFATVYRQTIGDMIKNVMVQGIAIQPAVSVVNSAVDNWINGKPITEGLSDAYITGAIQNTLVMGITHLATRPPPTMGKVQGGEPGPGFGEGPIIDGNVTPPGSGPAPAGAPRLPATIDPRDIHEGDEESIIDTSLIAEGRRKQRVALEKQAQASESAAISSRNGWPGIGSRVSVGAEDIEPFTGTVHSAFSEPHPDVPGAMADGLQVQLDNGDMLRGFKHDLDAAGITITPQQAQQAGLPLDVATTPTNQPQAQTVAATPAPAAAPTQPEIAPAQVAPQPVSAIAPETTGDGTQSAPIVVTHPDHLTQASDLVNTAPSEAQKEAGNYTKGHIKVQGLNITIENPAGSVRSGTGPEGPWSVKMPAAYGYVKRTTGADGEQVDVYVGPNPQSSKVFVVDQKDAQTGTFDEHKAILGANTRQEALDIYHSAFSDGLGPQRMGGVRDMNTLQFKKLLNSGVLDKPVAAAAPAEPKVPEKLYHGTPSENRESIRSKGLLLSKSEQAAIGGDGAVYASKIGEPRPHGIDLWEINTKDSNWRKDDTTDPADENDEWFASDSDIPPTHLKLVQSAGSEAPPAQTEGAKAILKTPRAPLAPSTETSVLENIRRMGGIKTTDANGKPTKEGQDIQAVLKDVNRPGLINNQTGQRPDTIREHMQEHGWFGQTGGHDIQDLYDLIDKETRNGPQFHPESERGKAVAAKAEAESSERARADAHAELDHFIKESKELFSTADKAALHEQVDGGFDPLSAVVEHIERRAMREQYEHHAETKDQDYAASLEPDRERAGEAAGGGGESIEGHAPVAPSEGNRDEAGGTTAPPVGAAGEARQGEVKAEPGTAVDGQGKAVPQTVIPGADRSAAQLAAAREAQGHGRATTSVTQKDAGGMFAPKVEEAPDLFGKPAEPAKPTKYTPEELQSAVEEYRALRATDERLSRQAHELEEESRALVKTGPTDKHAEVNAKSRAARKESNDHFDKIEAMARKWGAKGVDLDSEIAKPADLEPSRSIIDRFRGKKDEAPAAVAQPGNEQVGIGADLKRMIDLFGPKMYGADMPQVTAKELLQNSFDGIKAALQRGDIKPGEANIDIHFDRDARTFTITDNGAGMSPQIVKDAFLTVAGTDKGDLATEDRSGGFGIAKLAFIFGNDGLRLTTVRDGLKTTLDTNSKELLDGKADLKTVATKERPGTTVEVKFPKEYLSTKSGEKEPLALPYSATSFDALKKPLIGDVGINVTDQKWDGKRGEPESLPVGRNLPLDDKPKVTTAHFNWGDVDVYLGKRGPYSVSHEVLSSGLFQFSTGISTKPLAWDKLPYDIILNVRPSVGADSPMYPFNNQREDFSPKVKGDIAELSKYLQTWHGAKLAAGNSGAFADVHAMPITRKLNKASYNSDFKNLELAKYLPDRGTSFDLAPDITIRDGKTSIGGKDRDFAAEMGQVEKLRADKFSFPDGTVPTDAPLFHSNLNVDVVAEAASRRGVDPADSRRLLAGIGTIVQDFRNALAKVERYEVWADQPVGISLDKEYHGVHIAVPFKGFFLNPLSVREKTSEGIADSFIHTMYHEAAHTHVKDHSEAFTIELAKLTGAFGDANPGVKADLEAKLRDLLDREAPAFYALREVFNDATTTNAGSDAEGSKGRIVESGPTGGLSGRSQRGHGQGDGQGLREGDAGSLREGAGGRDVRGFDGEPSYSRVEDDHQAAIDNAWDTLISSTAKRMGWEGEPTSQAMGLKALLMPKGPEKTELARNARAIKALEDQRANPLGARQTPIQGDGETKVRGAAQSIADKAAKSGIALEDLPTYDVSHQAPFIARSEKFDAIPANRTISEAVAMGIEPPPYGTTAESMLIAVQNRATREGDAALLLKLATQSKVLADLTTAGQRISMMQNLDPMSPVAAIKTVQTARATAAKVKGGDIPKAKKDTIKDMMDAINKQSKRNGKGEPMGAAAKKLKWSMFVHSITCK